MTKVVENQELKSSGLLVIIGLVAFSSLLVVMPWNKGSTDSRVELARQKAEIVGYQLIQIYREASNDNASRKPASSEAEQLRLTGSLGQDPWGTPYRYRILNKSSQKETMKVIVWSVGSNGRVDTPALESEESEFGTQLVYGGDDIGVLLSMSQE